MNLTELLYKTFVLALFMIFLGILFLITFFDAIITIREPNKAIALIELLITGFVVFKTAKSILKDVWKEILHIL